MDNLHSIATYPLPGEVHQPVDSVLRELRSLIVRLEESPIKAWEIAEREAQEYPGTKYSTAYGALKSEIATLAKRMRELL